MWTYWDHPPRTRTPACQPISPLIISPRPCHVVIPLQWTGRKLEWSGNAAPEDTFLLFARTKTTLLICTPHCAIVWYSNFVSNTSFFLLPSSPPKKVSFYWFSFSPGELVTPMLPLGLPPLLALFQAALFHLNFNPIYGLSYPPARPGRSNYSSSRLHVTLS